jgi:diguanylate cyclase (GGDEF)-like protein
MLLRLLRRYGYGPTLVGLVLASVLLSVLITAGVNLLIDGYVGRTGLLIATMVAGTVSLLFGGIQLRLLHRLGQARDELHRLSITDELTGAYNRRHFLVQAAYAFAQAKDHGEPFALVLFDADDFKKVNDTYGHLAGDRVLRQVAEATRVGLRSSDLLARWGGEEFIVLLPGTRLEEALGAAQRMQEGIAHASLGAEELRVTVSIGVAAFQPTLHDLDDLLSQADNALYRAKAEGKNRIEMVSAAS